jgi:hypothetical protein
LLFQFLSLASVRQYRLSGLYDKLPCSFPSASIGPPSSMARPSKWNSGSFTR